MQREPLPPYPLSEATLPAHLWYGAVKRVFDVVVAAVLFPLAIPFILISALLVRATSTGPIFSSQIRLGRFGRPFRLWKLRTTIEHGGRAYDMRRQFGEDPQLTAVGYILRLTCISELPQLWNVLKGDLSFIGPQPDRPEFVPLLESAIPNYHQRMAIRPGMTGLSQVNMPRGTGMPSVRKKVQLDLLYIREAGPLLDLRLLAATLLLTIGFSREIIRLMFTLPQPVPEAPLQTQRVEPAAIAMTFADNAAGAYPTPHLTTS